MDKHALTCAGLRLLIEQRAGWVVVGQAHNPADALTLAAATDPHIILYELSDGYDESVDLIGDLLAVARAARLLLVTGVHNPEVHHRAVQRGAIGIVFKDHSAETLFKAIVKVHAGEAWFERALIADVLTKYSRAWTAPQDPEQKKIAALSMREREVISLIGAGLKNKEVADRLCISEITVRHHLTSIFAKLAVADRLELVIYAYRNGLAQLPT